MWHKKNYLSCPFDLADIKRISFWEKDLGSIGSHTHTNTGAQQKRRGTRKIRKEGEHSLHSSTGLSSFLPPLAELKKTEKRGRNLGVNRIKEGIAVA